MIRARFETKATQPELAPEKLYAEPVDADSVQVVWQPLQPGQCAADKFHADKPASSAPS